MTPHTTVTTRLMRPTGLALAVVGLTASLVLAQVPAPPAPPAAPPPAAAAPPAPSPPPAPPAPPWARATPSRNLRIAVTVSPAAGTVTGTPRVLTVTTADGRPAQVRRTGQPGNDFYSLDATATLLSDKQVLIEFKVQANASDQADAKLSVGIAQEGAILLAPGVRQRVTQLDDSGGRPNLHVDVQVDIVR